MTSRDRVKRLTRRRTRTASSTASLRQPTICRDLDTSDDFSTFQFSRRRFDCSDEINKDSRHSHCSTVQETPSLHSLNSSGTTSNADSHETTSQSISLPVDNSHGIASSNVSIQSEQLIGCDVTETTDSPTNQHSSVGAASTAALNLVCPVCLRRFSNAAACQLHTKRCARVHGLGPRELVGAVALQQRQCDERARRGLPEPASISVSRPGRRRNGPVRTRATVEPSIGESDLQLALAVSASLHEQQQQQQQLEGEPAVYQLVAPAPEQLSSSQHNLRQLLLSSDVSGCVGVSKNASYQSVSRISKQELDARVASNVADLIAWEENVHVNRCFQPSNIGCSANCSIWQKASLVDLVEDGCYVKQLDRWVDREHRPIDSLLCDFSATAKQYDDISSDCDLFDSVLQQSSAEPDRDQLKSPAIVSPLISGEGEMDRVSTEVSSTQQALMSLTECDDDQINEEKIHYTSSLEGSDGEQKIFNISTVEGFNREEQQMNADPKKQEIPQRGSRTESSLVGLNEKEKVEEEMVEVKNDWCSKVDGARRGEEYLEPNSDRIKNGAHVINCSPLNCSVGMSEAITSEIGEETDMNQQRQQREQTLGCLVPLGQLLWSSIVQPRGSSVPTDCHIKCRNGTVSAHRLVLQARDCRLVDTPVETFSVRSVSSLLEFLYTGQLSVTSSNNELVQLCNLLGVGKLLNPVKANDCERKDCNDRECTRAEDCGWMSDGCDETSSSTQSKFFRKHDLSSGNQPLSVGSAEIPADDYRTSAGKEWRSEDNESMSVDSEGTPVFVESSATPPNSAKTQMRVGEEYSVVSPHPTSSVAEHCTNEGHADVDRQLVGTQDSQTTPLKNSGDDDLRITENPSPITDLFDPPSDVDSDKDVEIVADLNMSSRAEGGGLSPCRGVSSFATSADDDGILKGGWDEVNDDCIEVVDPHTVSRMLTGASSGIGGSGTLDVTADPSPIISSRTQRMANRLAGSSVGSNPSAISLSQNCEPLGSGVAVNHSVKEKKRRRTVSDSTSQLTCSDGSSDIAKHSYKAIRYSSITGQQSHNDVLSTTADVCAALVDEDDDCFVLESVISQSRLSSGMVGLKGKTTTVNSTRSTTLVSPDLMERSDHDELPSPEPCSGSDAVLGTQTAFSSLLSRGNGNSLQSQSRHSRAGSAKRSTVTEADILQSLHPLRGQRSETYSSSIRDVSSVGREYQSPSKKVQSPIKKFQSPSGNIQSPTQTINSPSKNIQSSSARAKSSSREVQSPSAKVQSPSRKDVFPRKNIHSPSGKCISSSSQIQSHSGKIRSPSKKIHSPSRQVQSSSGKVQSPSKKIHSPSGKCTSSSLQIQSPRVHSRSRFNSTQSSSVFHSNRFSGVVTSAEQSHSSLPPSTAGPTRGQCCPPGGQKTGSSVDSVGASHSDSTPSTQRHRVTVVDSHTPIPNYVLMLTPELKAELARIGVKPIARRKAVALLKHVFDETHPTVETARLPEAAAAKRPTPSCSQPTTKLSRYADKHVAPPSTSARNLSPSKSPIKTASPLSSPLKSSTSSQALGEETGGSEHPVSSSSDDDSVRSDDEICPEESILFEKGLDTAELLTGSQMLPEAEVNSAITAFIRSRPQLYQQILVYEPIWLESLHAQLKTDGVRVSLSRLIDFLDDQCITFRTQNSGRRRRSPKKAKRTAKSSSSNRGSKPGSTQL